MGPYCVNQSVNQSVFRSAAVVLAALIFASPALAQRGAVRGTVHDSEGKGIKGATVTASHPTAIPGKLTATTDDKGRFALIGLASGQWMFEAEAPGFMLQRGGGTIRATTTGNMPVQFMLPRAIVPLPGALSRQILDEIEDADKLRSDGRFDQAISAYLEIAKRNEKLTMVSLAIGESYRQKAAKETLPAERQRGYDQAIAAYRTILAAEPDHERARIELALTQVQKGSADDAEQTLKPVAESASASGAVVYALGEIRMTRGDAGGAEQMFQRAATLDPGWLEPRVKLGVIAMRKGDRSQAQKLFQSVIATDASSPEAADAGKYLKEIEGR